MHANYKLISAKIQYIQLILSTATNWTCTFMLCPSICPKWNCTIKIVLFWFKTFVTRFKKQISELSKLISTCLKLELHIYRRTIKYHRLLTMIFDILGDTLICRTNWRKKCNWHKPKSNCSKYKSTNRKRRWDFPKPVKFEKTWRKSQRNEQQSTQSTPCCHRL